FPCVELNPGVRSSNWPPERCRKESEDVGHPLALYVQVDCHFQKVEFKYDDSASSMPDALVAGTGLMLRAASCSSCVTRREQLWANRCICRVHNSACAQMLTLGGKKCPAPWGVSVRNPGFWVCCRQT